MSRNLLEWVWKSCFLNRVFAHQVKEESGVARPGADFPGGAVSHTASGEGNPVLSIPALLASGGRDCRRGYRHGGSAMRIITFIDQPEVIEKIVTHLGLWLLPFHTPPPRTVA